MKKEINLLCKKNINEVRLNLSGMVAKIDPVAFASLNSMYSAFDILMKKVNEIIDKLNKLELK